MNKRYGKMYGEVEIGPGVHAAVTFAPTDTPFFVPERVKWDVRDEEGYAQDLRVGSVTIGGSPQLGFNSLTMGDGYGKYMPSVSIMDIADASGWSACSGPGCARELQMSLWNSHRKKAVTAKICIEGYGLDSLDERSPPYQRCQRRLIASPQVMVDGKSWQKISVAPMVSPYFDVKRVRYHAFSEAGYDVEINIIGVLVGNRMVSGATDLVSLLMGGEKVQGIPTSLNTADRGWEDGRYIGEVSTRGLGRELWFVVENPSEGLARVSITCEGLGLSSLGGEADGAES